MSEKLSVNPPENLTSFVHIKPNGLRSIQIESDLENQSLTERYVLTGQSRACLSRILIRINDFSYGRSWTLTGPYGSGKSFFSIFLMNLVSLSQPGYKHAVEQLSEVDPALSEQIQRDLKHSATQGLFPVAITGFRASFQECLKHGLVQALRRIGTNPSIELLRTDLQNWTAQTDSRAVIDWIRAFIKALTSPEINYRGLLLIFDEMGKPLEFAASRPDEIDVYLLQELAEFANRSGEYPFVFIGVLHQAFDRYATSLDQTTRREWAKVQGRFEDISFQEPQAQQIRLLVRALESVNPQQTLVLVPNLSSVADASIEVGWCPALMSREEFAEICQAAYPFHPSSLVVLPHLFKRLAQNERSIFAYLASFEPFGFQEFLRCHTTPDFLRLPDLFDYLVANFQSRLYASSRARTLTETLERLNSSASLSGLDIEIIKTIGLLSWLAEVSTLQPTDRLITSALITDQITSANIRQALEKLRKQSFIVFRRYNRTYAIWQGSDVDLDERMEQAQRQVSGAFSLAEAVQQYLPPRPLVARRHSYQTGTLRFFEVRYADLASLNEVDLIPKQGASGLVLVCLAANPSEVPEFVRWAEQPSFQVMDGTLVGITKRTAHLSELLYDLRCYHWIEENTPELRDDKIAQKELFTRINSIETLIQNELDRSVSLHHLANASGCVWKYRAKEFELAEKVGISQILSSICDTRYGLSPIIRNELINRRVMSSQSAAARRNLIEAMLTKTSMPQLGIEGYPPERSMYESLLARGGLHLQIEPGKWEIVKPGNDDPLHLRAAWQEMEDYTFTASPHPRPVVELYRRLMDAPFGITEGVLPVLFCAFLIVYQEETTIYREGTLLPEPGVPDWEVLLRRPELFSVAGCRVTGTRAAIVARIGRGFNTQPLIMPIVRELIRRLKSLPEYAWRTNLLSREAIALRRAIDLAHSPEKLLFVELPESLGLEPIVGDELNAEELEEFFKRLNKTLAELANATPRRRDWARDVFLKACELSTTHEGWYTFLEITREMNGRIAQPNLAPLVKRAAEAPDPTAALDSVLALIANRPLRAWSDIDVNRFPMLAQSLGRQFISERNGYLPGLTLTRAEKQRSQELAQQLLSQLDQSKEDRRVLQAALQQLIDFLRSND